MYIKSMVIDGFKSYAQRTEINGFDQLFNAITGLNGSGKSNILDSICFLLGITNLSQVRASSLQELVYKNGQAGITKASVSITFDNADKQQSPLGYEQYDEITITRQVVIGGRNKYLINGINANNTRVQDLFRSIQLNVNNPHFLIMQGRITKVLNMKPPEILSMIEEAAGTRLYESKKESAQKTIEKKDAKLKEIDTILKEEITPILTRLKEERSSYLEYQKINREYEHLSKLYIAYQFLSAEELKKTSVEELTKMKEAQQGIQDKTKANEEKIVELDQLIERLEKKRDEETGGKLEQLEVKLNDAQKLDAKSQSTVHNKKDAINAEEKKRKDLVKQFQNDKSTLESKEKELEKLSKKVTTLQEEHEQNQKDHTAAQEHFQAISAGLSTNKDGQEATLNDQLMAAKKDLSAADTDTKQASMKLKHAEQEVKKKRAELKKTEQSYKKEADLKVNIQKNMENLKSEMSKLNFDQGIEEKLVSERRNLVQDLHMIREKVESMEARFPQLQLDYKDPEKNFDRRKIHGIVANLIKVKDVSTATGLEVAAGGKLYNVVVDTEVTGKKLLQKGELKRRYTIIPLNKIAARTINPASVKRAESLVGKQNVHTALSLVGYENDLQSAMEFVFGNTFVCRDMNSANKVTFDKQILKRSVTLDGDAFDPAGTLSGGARAKSGSILKNLSELKEAQDALNTKQQKFQQIENQLTTLKRTAEKYHDFKQQYDLKTQELNLLEQKLQQSAHHQQLEEINTLQQSIDEQRKVLDDAASMKEDAGKRVKEIEYKLKNAQALREQELKEAEATVKAAKKKLEDFNKNMRLKKQEADSIKLEVEEIKKELKNCEDQQTACDEVIKGLTEQLEQLTQAAEETKGTVKELQKEIGEQKELLKACNKEITEKATERRNLQKEIGQMQLQSKETEHKLAKMSKDSKDAARTVETMLQQYEWIADEKKYFGKPNTAYDFHSCDVKEAGRRMQKLQDTKEKLAKNVNMRAMNMLSKAEEQYNDLMKKRKIVLNDKTKIAAVIAELDEKKKETLKKAYGQVNKDFSSIFSTLLPGTEAKLVPEDGKTILDGLAVKVAFGDVWKESLSELSGGQRSLVALSLILALLLFKPAPIYILDEVDAALDLSHTQNIGHMLKTHFKSSQFIVVSLKDGMFNNANVLFKTKFVDGVSTVTRYVQNAGSHGARLNSTTASNKGRVAGKENKRARVK